MGLCDRRLVRRGGKACKAHTGLPLFSFTVSLLNTLNAEPSPGCDGLSHFPPTLPTDSALPGCLSGVLEPSIALTGVLGFFVMVVDIARTELSQPLTFAEPTLGCVKERSERTIAGAASLQALRPTWSL